MRRPPYAMLPTIPMSKYWLVLASTSPYRRSLIERLGVRVEMMAFDLDECAAE